MAISKIKPRHASEGRSIAAVLKDRLDYDKNPEKTKGGLLVSSYQCSADTAWQEFTVSKQIYEATTGRRRDHRHSLSATGRHCKHMEEIGYAYRRVGNRQGRAFCNRFFCKIHIPVCKGNPRKRIDVCILQRICNPYH